MLHQGILPILRKPKNNVVTLTISEMTSLAGPGLIGYLQSLKNEKFDLIVQTEGSNYTLIISRTTGTILLGKFILTDNVFILNFQYPMENEFRSWILIKPFSDNSNAWEKVLRTLEYYLADLYIYGADPYARYCYYIGSQILEQSGSDFPAEINTLTINNNVYEFNLLLNGTYWLSQDYIDIYTGATTNGILSANIRGKVTQKEWTTISKEELTLAGQPVVSNGLDENGKYITINVPNSPTDTPTGNIYRNGGSEPVGKYISTGNKTAKWYITDSPIGDNGDAYTANQVYNDGISTLYSLISNTTLVNWTYIEWSLHEEPNHIIRVNAKELGSFSNIKIYKNEEDAPVIDKTPSGDYDELFDVSAYGPATYKVVVTPRAGYKFDSDYTDTQYITLNLETIEIQTEFNEINGELSANKNEYIEQMNVTPNEGWTRKDYRTVVINESGTYTISLISNSTWHILIPVPATYNITVALDTPLLNVEMSNQLDLVWDETESTTYYEIYQDGVLIDSVPSETNNTLMARSIENKEKKRWIKNV